MRVRYRTALQSMVLAAAVVVPAGCYSVGEPTTVDGQTSLAYQNRFGYAAVGIVANASFFGEIRGIERGTGITIYVPPLATLENVIAIGAATVMALPIAIIEGYGQGDGTATGAVFEGVYEGMTEAMNTREHSRSGLAGALAKVTRNVISDVSFDFALSFTHHEDTLRGGGLNYAAILLGVRLAGARYHVPRIYAIGGGGWYALDYSNRSDAYVFGPYVGVGAEIFNYFRNVSLGLEYRAHFYFGDDTDGDPVDGGQGQLSALFSWYW